MTTLAEQMDASIVTERVIATLSRVAGVLGALLAASGFYGLLAYSVARRIPEIGVRMALGATERDVIRMVLADAGVLVAAGLLMGFPSHCGARASRQAWSTTCLRAPSRSPPRPSR